MKIDSIKYGENLEIDETAQKDVIISGHYDGPKDLMEKFKNVNKLLVSIFYWHDTPEGVIKN